MSREQKRRRGRGGRKRTPMWALILVHIALIGIALVVFALFHHVIPRKQEALMVVSSRQMATPVPTVTPVPETTLEPGEAALSETLKAAMAQAMGATLSPETALQVDEAVRVNLQAAAAELAPVITATPVPTLAPAMEATGYFGTKFKDKFTHGEVKRSASGYRSDDVNIAFKSFDKDGVQFHVADIYIRDISCFQTSFAQDTYGIGYTEWTSVMCKNMGGILAINGDQYGARKDGNVIRNGVLYREDRHPDRDVCVLYWDGTMETYAAGSFNAYTAIENGAYQAWNFGPMLLDENGKALSKFSGGISGENPRTAIGYFEPGHYCFVVVDGRSDDSDGMTLKQLAALMQSLGCQRAYNLDGGQTSVMVAGDTVISNPYNGGRKTSDILLIVDP